MIHEPPKQVYEPPFIAEVTNEPTKGATFRPTARVLIGNGIRDLAKGVGLQAVGVLAVLASHVTTNGQVAPTARTLSRAVGPALLVRLRLHRLARTRWRGQPILRIVRTAAGLEQFKPSGQVLVRREVTPAITSAAPAGAARVREAIVVASRAAYSRDRETVEREIMARNGWPSPEEREEAAKAMPKEPTDVHDLWAVQRLVKETVDYSLAVKLVNRYGADRVLRQVKWLDRRKVKNRHRYVVAAIIADYLPPTNNQEDSE